MHYSITAADVFIGLGGGSIAERRAKIEHEESLSLAERQLQLKEQHRLHLPHAINHKLLEVIAKETELTLAAVQQEQARRNAKKRTPASA